MSQPTLHKAPAFLLCCPFAIGIWIANKGGVQESYIEILLLILFLMAIVLQSKTIRKRSFLNTIYLAIILMSTTLIGNLNYHYTNNNYPLISKTSKAHYHATVTSIPVEKPKTYKINLHIDSCNTKDSCYLLDINTLAYFTKDAKAQDLVPGQNISFHSQLSPIPSSPDADDFDYRRHMYLKGFLAQTYIPKDAWNKKEIHSYSIKLRASLIQYQLLQLFQELDYNPKETALLSALTIGYKDLIDQDLRQAYIASGATHVLAVSGLHVGIIFIILSRLFNWLKVSRLSKTFSCMAIILCLWGFAFITGLSPSVTRATVMFSIIGLGKLRQHGGNIYNTIFFSAFLLLCYNPNYLFDIGFQLSYAAVLGIVAFYPPVSNFLHKRLKIPRLLAEVIAVSQAAQVGTLPLCIHIFNCYPSYTILANIWIIPFVSLIIYLTIILLAFSFMGWSYAWLATLLGWSLKGMNAGIQLISELPQALHRYLYLDNTSMALAYLIIFISAVLLVTRSKKLLFALPVLIFLILANFHHTLLKESEQQKLFIFRDYKHFNMGIQQGCKAVLIQEQDAQCHIPAYFTHHLLARHTQIKSLLSAGFTAPNLIKKQDFIISPNHIHAIFSKDLEQKKGKINITSLIIKKDEPKSIYTLYRRIKFKELVLHQKPKRHIKYYERFCYKNNIRLHKVYEDGCYSIGL